MDARLREEIEAGRIPGAVLLAADTSGDININRSYGVRSLKDPSAKPPMTPDTPLRLASCTKLVTAVMILQAYEKGFIDDLECPVEDHLPEVGDMRILTGFSKDGSNKPMLRAPQGPITLKQLLSHSSGCCYRASNLMLTQWTKMHDKVMDGSSRSLEENFLHPLLFEPGTDFNYGTGPDWAGRYMERVTGMSLEEWLQEHVVKPLGITDMTFMLHQHPEMLAKLGDMSEYDAKTGNVAFSDRKYFHWDPIDCMGGQGIFMSPAAFFAVMRSVLLDDGKLLSSDSRELLFEPALSEESEEALNRKCREMALFRPAGLLEPEDKKSHSLAGVLVTENVAGGKGRRAGSISWSGMPHNFWTIDPAAGVCMLSCFNMEPWGSETCFDLGKSFEEEVYSLAG